MISTAIYNMDKFLVGKIFSLKELKLAPFLHPKINKENEVKRIPAKRLHANFLSATLFSVVHSDRLSCNNIKLT